jgi:hypothetical protein
VSFQLKLFLIFLQYGEKNLLLLPLQNGKIFTMSVIFDLHPINVFKYIITMKRTLPVICLAFLFSTCASVSSSYAQGRHSYKIGDTGPAGGIVFYDKGDDSDDWRYLEAAPPEFEFEGNWNSANDMVKLLNINGFTDWRLPNRDELSFMYLNLKQKGLGGFGNNTYWSSTEERALLTFTMYHNFGNGLVFGADNLGRGLVSYKVRAIREF